MFYKPPNGPLRLLRSNQRSRLAQVAKLILAEVAELFPDEFLHVGGDEVRGETGGRADGFGLWVCFLEGIVDVQSY